MAILTSEPPTSPGGVEHFVAELTKGLDQRGYDVQVLHRRSSAPSWLHDPQWFLVRQFGDLFVSWYLGQRLYDLKDRELAAVISNGPVGLHVPMINGRRYNSLHIYHGTYRQQAEAIRPFIKYRGYLKLKWWDSMVLERACGRGKVLLCNSDQTRDEIHRHFGFLGTTTWLPLDTAHFQPLDQRNCRHRLGLAERDSIGIFVGGAHPTKGFPVVQTLIDSLPGIRWILALRGGVPESLRGNSRVFIFENACRDLLPTLYGAADFAISPSRYESFGYVVAEALSCGIPVIASPGGASRLFLQDPPLDSLLVNEACDAEAYVRTARDVLSDPPRYRQAVLKKARPRVVQTMAPENWWPRFLAATGL